MDDQELYGDLTQEQMDAYTEEARQRWGNSDAFKQSQERTKNMTQDDFARIAKEGDELMRAIVAAMDRGVQSPEIQELIAQHYNALRTFYEPNLIMYKGLGDMYVADPRFKAHYEKYAEGLAEFMRDAMHYFVDHAQQ